MWDQTNVWDQTNPTMLIFFVQAREMLQRAERLRLLQAQTAGQRLHDEQVYATLFWFCVAFPESSYAGETR